METHLGTIVQMFDEDHAVDLAGLVYPDSQTPDARRPVIGMTYSVY